MTVIKKLNANDKVKVKVVPDPIHNGSWNPKSNITDIGQDTSPLIHKFLFTGYKKL